MTRKPTIRPLAPRICPQCASEHTFVILENRIECRHCGYALRKDDGQPLKLADAAPPVVPPLRMRQPLTASYRISNADEVNPWAKAAFSTAQDCVHRQDWAGALEAFLRALEHQPDFIDAHLWIARIDEDTEKRRGHLTTLLAYQPDHLEAIRELMLLDGRLSAEAAAIDEHAQPQRVRAGGAVGTHIQTIRCPSCGSLRLEPDPISGLMVCAACGQSQRPAASEGSSASMLTQALLERRAQPVQWVIGERLLACQGCGAQRTIPARKLSGECPFCGSNQVIERDVLGSFQQPDYLVPFAIKRQQAVEAIRERLETWTERFQGWFNNNRMARQQIDGVYMPFWLFDASVQVRRTILQNTQSQGENRPRMQRASMQQAYQTYVTPDAVYNVLVCAVEPPPLALSRRLGKFPLERRVPYEPKLLARFPAELYTIDFDQASLEARSQVAQTLRERHSGGGTSDQTVNVFPSVTQMSFQLVLLPVWVVTIHEEDGDIRPALVNGQTGQVVLGRSRRPSPT